MKHIPLFLITLLLAGCTHSNPPSHIEPGPCYAGYYVGCDNNPDAYFMLEKYGLHQFTNITDRTKDAQADGGLIALVQAAPRGQPAEHIAWVYDPLTGKSVSYNPPSWLYGRGGFFSDGLLLTNDVPGGPAGTGNQLYNLSRPVIWDPMDTEVHEPARPPAPRLNVAGFGGGWGLTMLVADDYRTHGNGLAAFHVWNDTYHELTPIRPIGGHGFGYHLAGYAVGGGYAFVSLLENVAGITHNCVVAVNLTTGDRMEILNLTNDMITRMDANERYMVLTTNRDGRNGVWAWDMSTREWFFVQEERRRDAFSPVVGGDWIVYVEGSTQDLNGTLLGYHIPSATYNVLLDRGNKDFGIPSFDTDGRYAVLDITLGGSHPSPFAHRESNNLYWMELPDLT